MHSNEAAQHEILTRKAAQSAKTPESGIPCSCAAASARPCSQFDCTLHLRQNRVHGLRGHFKPLLIDYAACAGMSEGADGMRKRLFRGDHVSAAESAAKPPVSAGSVATQAAEPAPVLAKQQSVAPPVPEKMLRPDNVFRKHIEHEEQPRQVVMLMLMLVPFIYLAVFAPISEDTVFSPREPCCRSDIRFPVQGALKKNITHCFFAVVGVASCWGAVSLPDGLMVSLRTVFVRCSAPACAVPLRSARTR